MWRHLSFLTSLLFFMSLNGCAMDNTPKRLMEYLPTAPPDAQAASSKMVLPDDQVSAALVVLNDTGFEKSAPELRKGTLHDLGEQLKAELEKQLPIRFSNLVYPETLAPQGSSDMFARLAKEQAVPFLLVAVMSSSEWEVFDRLPMQGMQQGGGMRGMGMPGYRAENYARMELALLDGQTGRPVLMTDGQAWATLERLVVPLESNVYPVVRRDLTQPPIYPNSEEDAYETLRWVSGKGALAQAVMHLEEEWKKNKAS